MNKTLTILLSLGVTLPCLGADERPLLKPSTAIKIHAGNVATVDVNGDGRSDLLIPNKDGLHIYRSNAEGFVEAEKSPIKVRDGVSELVITDANGDGHLDVVTCSHDSYSVSVLLSDGRDGFSPAIGSPFAAKEGEHPHTHGLAVADFNNDGKPDVAIANNEDNDISLLLGNKLGKWDVASKSPFPCGKAPYPVAVADLNGDGNQDIVVPNSGPNLHTVTILRGDGSGGFSRDTATIKGQPFFATTGDLNGDGKPDVIVSDNDSDDATVLLNDGKGQLATTSILKMGTQAWGIAITDMNGDGKPDLVAAAKDVVRVFLNDGHANFKPAAGSPYATGKGTWRLAIGDFNRDGKKDVAATCVEEDRVAILLGQ